MIPRLLGRTVGAALTQKTSPARKSDVTLAWDQRVALLDTKKSEIVQG